MSAPGRVKLEPERNVETRLKDLSPELAKRKKYRKKRKQRNKKLDFKIKLI